MFSGRPVFVSNIMEKIDKQIFMKLLWKVRHEARNTLDYFRDLVINPLNAGLIFLFSGSVFVSNIMKKNEWMDFNEIFICQAPHQKQSSRQFHIWLDCFTVSNLGVVECLWASLW